MIEWLVNRKVFRNANHAIWFLTSIGFLALSLAWHFFPRERLILLVIPAVVHLPPFITSTVIVLARKGESEIYSRDCIWFNGVLILVYVFLFLYL